MDIPVRCDDRTVGWLQVERQEGDTSFVFRPGALEPGLYRIVVQGTAGTLTLGAVEGGAVLHRRFSDAMTRPLGRAVSAVAQRCTGGSWLPARQQDFPHLPLPAGALMRRSGQGYTLALPFDADGPFPLPQLFCFARVCRMEGRQWVLYRLDHQGRPLLP